MMAQDASAHKSAPYPLPPGRPGPFGFSPASNCGVSRASKASSARRRVLHLAVRAQNEHARPATVRRPRDEVPDQGRRPCNEVTSPRTGTAYPNEIPPGISPAAYSLRRAERCQGQRVPGGHPGYRAAASVDEALQAAGWVGIKRRPPRTGEAVASRARPWSPTAVGTTGRRSRPLRTTTSWCAPRPVPARTRSAAAPARGPSLICTPPTPMTPRCGRYVRYIPVGVRSGSGRQCANFGPETRGDRVCLAPAVTPMV